MVDFAVKDSPFAIPDNGVDGVFISKKVSTGNKIAQAFPENLGKKVIPSDHTVLIDPNLQEIPGRVYQTWSNADAYITAQSPSATNLWQYIIVGNNSEDIIQRDFVKGVGIGCILSGNITSAVTNPANLLAFENIEFQELTITTGKFFQANNSVFNLSAQSFAAGYLITYNSRFETGNFSGLTMLISVNSGWIGGTFDENCVFHFCLAELGSTAVFNGGSFFKSTFTATDTLNPNYQWFFEGCSIGGQTWTLGANSDITIINSNFTTSTYITISTAGAIIKTNAVTCDYSFDISGTEIDNWTNLTNVVKINEDNVSNPPTAAELNSIFTAPDKGFVGYIDDNGSGANFYKVMWDGSNWWIFTGTKAV